MTYYTSFLPWSLLSSVFCLLALGEPVFAQIVPDNSQGNEQSVVTSVNSQLQQITGGATRGSALFHSFLEFNINEGNAAYFVNPAAIETIFSRVTGNNPSEILGTLGVLGEADLYLINPNGILFGPNAQLDIKGSFIASTANSLVLPNGIDFSATNPQTPPLLEIDADVSIGLVFEGGPPGDIVNAGSLAVGEDLQLVAGNLDLQGELVARRNLTLQANNLLSIRDSETKPFLAVAGEKMLIQGNEQVDIFALNHSNSGFSSGGDLVLRSRNPVGGDAHYWSGGNFQIEGLDGSLGDLHSPYDPIIRSHGDVSFENYVGTSLHILAGGRVNIPGVVVITDSEVGTVGTDFLRGEVDLSQPIVLANGDKISQVQIDGSSRPTFEVRAGVQSTAIDSTMLGTVGNRFPRDIFFNSPLIPAAAPGNNPTATSADINIGGIAMLGSDAADGLVFLTNQFQPNTSLPGGDIKVGVIVTSDGATKFTDNLPPLINLAANFAGLLDGFSGNGGDVIIDSRQNIAVAGGLPEFGVNSSIIDTSSATGDAGNIFLLAEEQVSLENSSVLSNANGSVKGGEINVTARSVSLSDNSRLGSIAVNGGEGGDVKITATDTLKITGKTSDIRETIDAFQDRILPNLSDTTNFPEGIILGTQDSGNAGSLQIAAGQLQLQSAAILNGTLGDGHAGKIEIKVQDSMTVDNGLIAAFTAAGGNAGEMQITAPDLQIQNQAVVATSTAGQGNNGNLTINSQRLTLNNEGAIAIDTRSSGNAQQLTIASREVVLTGNSVISGISLSRAPDAGQAGGITIEDAELVRLNDSSILTESRGAKDAGNVKITTVDLLLEKTSVISTGTLGFGDGGDIEVNASESIRLIGALDGLPSALVSLTSGSGNAGTIGIDTKYLIIEDGGVISALTSPTSNGKGGSITVNASELVLLAGTSSDNLIPSSISVDTTGTGIAGTLTINTRQFIARDGARISALTLSPDKEGRGGRITLNALELVELSGRSPDGLLRSGVQAQTFGEATAGNITITTNDLRILNGGTVNVSGANAIDAANFKDRIETIFDVISSRGGNNPGSISSVQGTGDAGDILVDANTILLLDQGEIVAVTPSGEGGNIDLFVHCLLLLRNNSQISTTAGTAQAGGNGGNITIDAPNGFIIAFPGEDSDITANAFEGNGGRVNISTQAIFGLEFRDRETSLSDITASSEQGLAGEVNINRTVETEPEQGLTSQPNEPVEVELIEGCQIGRGRESAQYSYIGEGGSEETADTPVSTWLPLPNSEQDSEPAVSGETGNLVRC
ncbi:MAG: filamentous hemagglutinin N-terminal domain-containing protein [Symploca sp. SIO3E6]|nr:filamentous hemagglutinin N-terminal domain-containing protein [Caldora sp. SIO3E6]